MRQPTGRRDTLLLGSHYKHIRYLQVRYFVLWVGHGREEGLISVPAARVSIMLSILLDIYFTKYDSYRYLERRFILTLRLLVSVRRKQLKSPRYPVSGILSPVSHFPHSFSTHLPSVRYLLSTVHKYLYPLPDKPSPARPSFPLTCRVPVCRVGRRDASRAIDPIGCLSIPLASSSAVSMHQ